MPTFMPAPAPSPAAVPSPYPAPAPSPAPASTNCIYHVTCSVQGSPAECILQAKVGDRFEALWDEKDWFYGCRCDEGGRREEGWLPKWAVPWSLAAGDEDAQAAASALPELPPRAGDAPAQQPPPPPQPAAAPPQQLQGAPPPTFMPTFGASTAAATATASYEYFTVDIGRDRPQQTLGMKVDYAASGLKIMQIPAEGPVAAWNQRCQKERPMDALRVSDIILKVNDVGVKAVGGCHDMMTELKQSMDLLLLIQRQTVTGETGMDV